MSILNLFRKVVDAFDSRIVRDVPDNGICLKQCCNGDNLILINI